MSIYSKKAPDGIGLLDDDGNLAPNTKEKLLNKVIEKANNLPPKISLAGLDINIEELSSMVSDENTLKHFEPTDGIEAHREKYPQYHSLYMDTLYVGCVKALDLPPNAQLKPIGLVDPTIPVLIIFDVIAEFTEGLLDFVGDVKAYITSKIHIVLSKIKDIIEFIAKFLLTFTIDLSFIKELIRALLADFVEEKIQPVIDKVDEKADEIKSMIIDKLTAVLEKLLGSSPFPIEIPFIPFELDFFDFNLGFDFSFPWFDLSIFQLDLPLGIITLIVEFLKGVVTIAQDVIAAIVSSVDAFIEALSSGIQAILEFMVNLVLDPLIRLLKRVWPDIEKYTIPAAHFIAMFEQVVPLLIVAIVGVLIGPGLITFGLATALSLI